MKNEQDKYTLKRTHKGIKYRFLSFLKNPEDNIFYNNNSIIALFT